MKRKIKISLDQITVGPRDETLDPLVKMMWAEDLKQQGYRRVSNAYCQIARIDRDDWIDVLARQMNCTRADFYNRDGSGPADHWRDHYVRGYSRDVHTVHPEILRLIPGYY